MEELNKIGKTSKVIWSQYSNIDTPTKNNILLTASELLMTHKNSIIEANAKDLEAARNNGIQGAMLNRLMLDDSRIQGMSNGLKQLAELDDPIGEITWAQKRPNGLQIQKQRVPFGVIGIIYEARPNVTSDAFGICLKTGNTSILRGGKEAIESNKAIVKVLQAALEEHNIPKEYVQLVQNTSRESAQALMTMTDYIDLLIPRGGKGLIKSVVDHAKVPVIETGVGNCHIFVDESADLKMAAEITINAKTQRPSVCNAAEKLILHKNIARAFLPEIYTMLLEKGVTVKGDAAAKEIVPKIIAAEESDWAEEYLDLIISVKIVNNLEEAIAHINTYGSKHSEAIITENYSNSQLFLERVDAAAVYVNASTRFTDGEEFGYGAEIGISTQKLHARGPMGLNELTSTKYIIRGNGQIRE